MTHVAAAQKSTIRLSSWTVATLFAVGLLYGLVTNAAHTPPPLPTRMGTNGVFVTVTHQDIFITASATKAIKETPEVPKALTADRILSVHDADLYRRAFALQEKGDETRADEVLGGLKDKKLMGHVLADRYLRRMPTLSEAKNWMTSYAAEPEAQSIYNKARTLEGFESATLSAPITATEQALVANADDETLGFRGHPAKLSPSSIKLDAKIKNALSQDKEQAAFELLSAELKRGAVSITDSGDMAARIATSLLRNGQIERARSAAHMASEAGMPRGLWLEGLAAWQQKDTKASLRAFTELAQNSHLTNWDHAAAAFWAWRSAEQLHEDAQAAKWLAEAARYPRSFYGYMAERLNGSATNVTWTTPELNAKNVALLAQYPQGWQSLALMQIGKTDLAEHELRRLPLGAHRDLQNAALALAEKGHMANSALLLSGLATGDNGKPFESASYPLPAWQPTDGFKVERALLFALMKRESHFDPQAISGGGACGLLQIMPSTAKQITSDSTAADMSNSGCPPSLLDPATNLTVGQKYVRLLAEQPMIGDNLLLLLAAYNGGPGNLSHWLDDNRTQTDPLLFVEMMPVRETHDYVQQVLLHYWKYKSRLAEPELSSAQLAHGEWPRYALNTKDSIAARDTQNHGSTRVASVAK